MLDYPRFVFPYDQKVEFFKELATRYENPIAVLSPHENLCEYYLKHLSGVSNLTFYSPKEWKKINEISVVFDEDYFFFPGPLEEVPFLQIFFHLAARNIALLGVRSPPFEGGGYPRVMEGAFFNRLHYAKKVQKLPVAYITFLKQVLFMSDKTQYFMSDQLYMVSSEMLEIMVAPAVIFRLGKRALGPTAFLKDIYGAIPYFIFDKVVQLRLLWEFH